VRCGPPPPPPPPPRARSVACRHLDWPLRMFTSWGLVRSLLPVCLFACTLPAAGSARQHDTDMPVLDVVTPIWGLGFRAGWRHYSPAITSFKPHCFLR